MQAKDWILIESLHRASKDRQIIFVPYPAGYSVISGLGWLGEFNRDLWAIFHNLNCI
jgi:hypothetical protein